MQKRYVFIKYMVGDGCLNHGQFFHLLGHSDAQNRSFLNLNLTTNQRSLGYSLKVSQSEAFTALQTLPLMKTGFFL